MTLPPVKPGPIIKCLSHTEKQILLYNPSTIRMQGEKEKDSVIRGGDAMFVNINTIINKHIF